MWPWGHLLFGYLLYSLAVRVWSGRRPTAAATLALAAGTQFPDLVDKPLAWWLAVLPSGRSLGHSLFAAGVVLSLVMAYAESRGRGVEGGAFGIGYLSHLVGDSLYVIPARAWDQLAFLLWPAVPAVEYPDESFAAQLAGLQVPTALTPELATSTALAGVVVLLWLADGAPVASQFLARLVGRDPPSPDA
jgi:hypothetical protein